MQAIARASCEMRIVFVVAAVIVKIMTMAKVATFISEVMVMFW